MTNEDQFSEIVIRGEQPIAAAEDLRSVLAMALRLENASVLLGAGASTASGGHSMSSMWNALEERHADIVSFLEDNRFLSTGAQNIELMISQLELALREQRRRGEPLESIADALQVLRHLVICGSALDRTLWNDPACPPVSEGLADHRRLLTRLLASRQPGQPAPAIFTTNYDLAVEWSAEALGIHVVNGFAGLHQRTFQPSVFDLSLRNATAQGEARFGAFDISLLKLHGSLSWFESEDQIIEKPAGQIADSVMSTLNQTSSKFNPLLIYPSTAKYVDTIGFVYGEMMRRFSEFMARQHTCLITCGYGFNDAHVNRLIAAGLQNPTMFLIAYFPAWRDLTKEIPNAFLQRLRSLGSPRVIIRGGGEAAYLNSLVKDLPDPTLIDDTAAATRRLAELLQGQNERDAK